MKIKKLFFVLLSFFALASCSKEPSFFDDFLGVTDADASSYSNGDDKKIDVKGSLTNGDMKHPDIEAWLSGSTLYVGFHKTVDNCMILVTNSSGRVVVSRRVVKQYPMSVRFYMGNEPSGDYHLYITDGVKDADGDFSLKK